MLLSIAMMVKNEEKYLERCLNAIKPILNKVESELIIVDTGSTDKTVEIAKKHTKKLYFSKWNNDFSEMRNITLGYCNGDWVFIIDGDEILENCDNIIKFFNSLDYKKYKSATIYVKNLIILEDENNFSIFPSLRLFKKDNDFKYVNAVHNQPLYKKPIKGLSTNCKHYGYICNDKELMERKFERTATILKSEIKKQPENIYFLYQLSVSYAMHNELDKAIEYIQKAYDIFIYKKYNINEYIYIYPHICLCYFKAGDYVNVKKYANECLKYKKTLIDIYYYLGISTMLLKEDEKAISALESYLKLHKNYYNTEKNIAIIDYTLCNINEVYYNLYLINRKIKQNGKAKKYLLQIDHGGYNIPENIVDLCIATKEYNYIKQYEEQLFAKDNTEEIKKLYIAIETQKTKLGNEEIKLLTELFSTGDTTYNYLNQIRIEYINNKKIDRDIIYSLLNKIELEKEAFYFADLIYYLIKSKSDILKLLSNLTFVKIDEYLKYLSNKYKDFNENIYYYIIEFSNNPDFNSVRINKELCKHIILINNLDKDKLIKIYNIYIELGLEYVEYTYSKFILENERYQDVRTEEEMFFLYMNKAKYYKNNDKKIYIQYLRKALGVNSYMKNVVEFLLNEEKKFMEYRDNEFEQYKIQIKNTIKLFIENADLKNAEDLIKEYESIVNNDVEIILFKSEIAIQKMKDMDSSKDKM